PPPLHTISAPHTPPPPLYPLSLHDALPIWSVATGAGGQSGVARSALLPCWPASGTRLPATCCGLRSSGHSGKSVSGVGETWWCRDRKSTRLNSSHRTISYAVFCLKKKKEQV